MHNECIMDKNRVASILSGSTQIHTHNTEVQMWELKRISLELFVVSTGNKGDD